MKNLKLLSLLLALSLVLFTGCELPFAGTESADNETIETEESSSERGITSWQQLPGLAKDISVGANGTCYVIGTYSSSDPYGGGVFRWTGSSWHQISGLATRVAVDPAGKPWVINKEGKIFRGNGSGGWTQLPGRGTDIAIGVDGTVYVIGTFSSSNPYGGGIFRWNGSGWTQIHGLATKVAVDRYGKPWVINKEGKIFQGNGSGGWTELPGRGSDIGIGANGSIYITGTYSSSSSYGGWVYEWNGSSWIRISGLATCITVDPAGKPWVANKVGHIFQGK